MKKIIAVILTVSFLAVTPAQAAGPDRPAQAADPGSKVVRTLSPGGGQWCCDALSA